MDSATRFILPYHMSPIKQNYDAAPLFRAAKEKVGFTPKILVSDGLQSFKTACKRAYLTLKKTIIHIREIHLQNRVLQQQRAREVQQRAGRVSQGQGPKEG